jgi:cyclopropane-fatty-acyl-phospholipid synthase
MISRLYTGTLTHLRTTPIRHAFVYPTYMFGLDLAELTRLDREVVLFGYNRRRLCSVWDRDYLEPHAESIIDKLRHLLARVGCGEQLTSFYLLTAPRVLQMGFNPLNLFWCFDATGHTRAVVVEVQNTYKESHPYVLHEPHALLMQSSGVLHYRFAKELFVSPFNGVEGVYDLRLSEPGDRLHIGLDLIQHGRPIIRAHLRLRGRPLDSRAVASTLARYPCTAALTLPRIMLQALVLRYTKGLRPRMKPRPTNARTIRRADPARRSAWLEGGTEEETP